MKATLDIPDDLYRRVKARSALEGRPLRSVAVELFQTWLNGSTTPAPAQPIPADDASAPWLAITRRYVRPGMSHEMDAIREAIATGSAAETTAKLTTSVR
jgi:hypothetical protein